MPLTELEQTIFLQKLPGVGSGTYWRLLEVFGSVAAILDAPPSKLSQAIPTGAVEQIQLYRKDPSTSKLIAEVRRDMTWLERDQVFALTLNHPHYPAMLKEITRPPAIIYVWGDPAVLSLPQLAIVGSRNPSSGGRQNAHEFARDLARGGFVVTSGLALGVDVAAHQGALDAGGQTVAVMGTGLDRIYPHRHRNVAKDIVQQGGAIISEFPLGTAANAANFPQRNRIISGLSAGVLVVEAAVKSGSLISARYAVQQNREVYAIPGSIHNPLSRGCHALIKEGAKLVECSADILEELGGYFLYHQADLPLVEAKGSGDESRVMEEPIIPMDAQEQQTLQALGFDSCTLDELSERTGLAASALLGCLIGLELKGVITPCGSGYAKVRRPAIA